jgi:vacuolar-type H+-ATPase subunit H
MEKARVLECYKIDDQAYQGTCTAIGLKNPGILTGEQLDQFDRVRGWLDQKEVKSFKEATERFKAEAEAKAKSKDAVDLTELKADILKEAEPTGEANAKAALENVVSLVKDAQKTAAQFTAQVLMGNFHKSFIEGLRSSEVQQQLRWDSKQNPALPPPKS